MRSINLPTKNGKGGINRIYCYWIIWNSPNSSILFSCKWFLLSKDIFVVPPYHPAIRKFTQIILCYLLFFFFFFFYIFILFFQLLIEKILRKIFQSSFSMYHIEWILKEPGQLNQNTVYLKWNSEWYWYGG